MNDTDRHQPNSSRAATLRRCSPTSAGRSRRSDCTASRTWPRPSGSSAGSASTRASPATSPPATPSSTDHFWVNPFGMDFGRIRVKDLLLVDTTARVTRAPAGQPGRVRDPLAVHAARPDVDRRRPLALALRQGVLDPGPHAGPDHPGPLRLLRRPRAVRRRTRASSSTARRASASPRARRPKAAILRNHGLLTVGHSVEEAAWWFIRMERCCHVQLLAEAAGTPVADRRRRWPPVTRRPGRHPRRRLVHVPAAVRSRSPRTSPTCSTKRFRRASLRWARLNTPKMHEALRRHRRGRLLGQLASDGGHVEFLQVRQRCHPRGRSDTRGRVRPRLTWFRDRSRWSRYRSSVPPPV